MGLPRRIALLCIDPWHWANGTDVKPFNYGARRIQAAILGCPDLAHCEVELIESLSLDAEEIAAELEAFNPDFIGASAFVWSFPALLESCRLAKLKRPDRVVVFGGPSARPEMLRLPQHSHGTGIIDALVEGDGESTIEDLLRTPNLSRMTMRQIPGLHVSTGEGWLFTGKRTLPSPDAHPSPYQMGLVPAQRQAEVESFRGCPLSCTYCEWGDTGVASRTFGFDYLVRELEALKKVQARSVWLVDPGLNLNHKAFQNLRRAEAETGALRSIGGFRSEIYPSHLTDEHLKFLQDVKAAHAGIGLQSMDKEVLRALERPFEEKKFDRVAREVASIVPDTAIEIIMGLPGDNPDNFKRTVDRVSQLPVAVRIFHCLVLPSALMTRAPAEFNLKFDPFTLKMISCKGWSEADFEGIYRWLDDNASNDGDTAKVRRVEFNVPKARQPMIAGETTPPRIPEVRGEATPTPGQAMAWDKPLSVPQELHDALDRSIRGSSQWTLGSAVILERDELRTGFIAKLQSGQGPLDLRVWPSDRPAPRFMEMEGVSYAYGSAPGSQLTPETIRTLKIVIGRLHPVAHAVIRGVGAMSVSPAAAHVVALGKGPIPPAVAAPAMGRTTTDPELIRRLPTQQNA